MIIAIDGPSGAGKSTVSKEAARRLGFTYIDTGAMYRAIGLKATRNAVPLSDEAEILKMLEETAVDLRSIDGSNRVFLDGEDVSELIRTPEISMAASNVSKLACVREKMTKLQREIGSSRDTVMDGRDIGTSVFPNAEVKIFLTASAEARAKRRYDELIAKGEKVTLSEVLYDIIKRDENDSNREIAPLRAADDAKIIDTSHLTQERSVEAVIDYINEVRR